MKNFRSFDAMMAQLDRIYKLYLKGYGSSKLIERAENFMFARFGNNVGLMV